MAIPTLYLHSLLAISQVPVIDIANFVISADLPVPSIAKSPNVGSHNAYKTAQQQNHDQIFAEVDSYVNSTDPYNEKMHVVLNDVAVNFKRHTVRYSLPPSNTKGKELFYEALNELAAMLQDRMPLNLMRSIYLVEHAYDPSIPFEYFDNNIKQAASHIQLKLDQEGYDPSDNLVKNMMIFRYMSDTLEVNYPGLEKPVITYPKSYDFDDFWGRRDYSKMFVSKLINEGTGQCHSLPLLYLLLAEEIGADASLAFAPNHSYIKFKDSYGVWQSIELTIGAITSENFIIEGGYVKSEAIKSKIYLEPVSKKQVIAQTVNDLIMAYTRKYGHENNQFIENAIGLVYQSFPNSITTHQIMANYYQERLNYVIWQYQKLGLTKEQFDNDQNAQMLLTQTKGANKHIDKLGYSSMPEEAYEDWLESVRKKAEGQYNQVKMEQLNNLIKE